MYTTSNSAPKLQQGGALMISIVLIFMMSLMGISAMRSANLDKKMSTNAVHKSRTLQAAESATELAIENRVAMSNAWRTEQSIPISVSLDSDPALRTSAQMRFIGLGLVPGSTSKFKGPKFETTGTASLDNVSATSIIVQGSYIAAPN